MNKEKLQEMVDAINGVKDAFDYFGGVEGYELKALVLEK